MDIASGGKGNITNVAHCSLCFFALDLGSCIAFGM